MGIIPLLQVKTIDQSPDTYIYKTGRVFAVFDHRTQDSGNVSYGVQVGEERFFLKTAGKPDAPKPISHDFSISLLRNAQRLWEKSRHPLLPELYQVIESPDGPLCVYEWADGAIRGHVSSLS